MKAKQPKKRKGPKSLNYVTKKKELERIDNENMKLMNRIGNYTFLLSTHTDIPLYITLLLNLILSLSYISELLILNPLYFRSDLPSSLNIGILVLF